MGCERRQKQIAVAVLLVGAAVGWASSVDFVKESIAKIGKNDPFKKDLLQGAGLKGRLVYTAYVREEGQMTGAARHFLVVRRIGVTPLVTPLMYRVGDEGPNLVFDPQFSPDGKQILFKRGWPYDLYGRYRFFLWDNSKQILRKGADEEVMYRRLLWSPNGAYIAFVTGVNQTGGPSKGSPGAELRVFDVKSGISHFVARNQGVIYFSWTPDNKLIFPVNRPGHSSSSVNSKDGDLKEDLLNEAKKIGIYEVFPVTGRPELVVPEENSVTQLAPSPNNRYVCYIAQKPTSTDISKLMIFDRVEKTVKTLDVTGGQLFWLSDNKELILFSSTHLTSNTEKGLSVTGTKATVRMVDIATLKIRDVVTLNENAKVSFHISGLSRGGQELILQRAEMTLPTRSLAPATFEVLFQQLNLKNGTIQSFAEIDTAKGFSLGWDWQEDLPNTPTH